jgi:hypothetical protein
MQARLEIRRIPATLVALILILVAAALLLGGLIGYTVKPASVLSRVPRTTSVSVSQPSTSQPSTEYGSDCQFVKKPGPC